MIVAAGHNARSESPLPGVARSTLVAGDRMLLVRFDLAPGSGVPLHDHPYEQAGVVSSGTITLVSPQGEWDVGPGDAWVIPAGELHAARSVGGAVIYEMFSPPRADYLPAAGPEDPDRAVC